MSAVIGGRIVRATATSLVTAIDAHSVETVYLLPVGFPGRERPVFAYDNLGWSAVLQDEERETVLATWSAYNSDPKGLIFAQMCQDAGIEWFAPSSAPDVITWTAVANGWTLTLTTPDTWERVKEDALLDPEHGYAVRVTVWAEKEQTKTIYLRDRLTGGHALALAGLHIARMADEPTMALDGAIEYLNK